MLNGLRRFSGCLMVLACQQSLWAHPGHGTSPAGDTASHYFTEPVHTLTIVGCMAALGVCILVVNRISRIARTRNA